MGSPVPGVGAKTYYLAIYLPKTAWEWKNLDQEGAVFPGVPLDPKMNSMCALLTYFIGRKWRHNLHEIGRPDGTRSKYCSIIMITGCFLHCSDSLFYSVKPWRSGYNVAKLKNLKFYHQVSKICGSRNDHFIQIHEIWKVKILTDLCWSGDLMICKVHKSKNPKTQGKGSWSEHAQTSLVTL